MTFTDIYAIRRVEKDDFVEIYSFADYLKFILYYPLLCMVVEVDGELAAFIVGNTNIDDGVVYGHVSSLVVRPSYRRRGFAMMLMEEFEKACRDELGCTFINFNVNHKNKAALSLYGKLGYSVHSTLPGYYQDASDALEMRKTIAT